MFGISRQKLYYWRKRGLFKSDEKSPGGHYRYGFQDLVALKTIKTLQDEGFTTYQIRKAFVALKKRYQDISNPFVQKPVIVNGKKIAIIDNGKVYDVLTGQMQILSIDIRQLEVSMKHWKNDKNNELEKINHISKKTLEGGGI